MSIYEITSEGFEKLQENSDFEISEREIQNMLLDDISVIIPDPENSPELRVIKDEFSKWKETDRRIDLLCVDSDANLVVVELKRKGDGGHMDLQSIRYSAMISNMTFDEAVDAYQEYLDKNNELEKNAKSRLLEFLGKSEDNIDEFFGNDVRIILVSPEFSKEITNTVLWLNDRGDPFITCIKTKPYKLGDRLLVNVEQIIPLEETSDFTMSYKRKAKMASKARKEDRNKYDLQLGKEQYKALPIRRVAHLTIKYIMENGVSKDDLIKNCDRLKNKNMFLEVDFDADSEQFRSQFKNYKNVINYFTEDENLVHASGKTYAIKSNWSKEMFEMVVPVLMRLYQQFDISYELAKTSTSE